MKKPFLLGFAGKAHSGKDFSADYIIQNYPNLKVAKVAFADAVRDMVRPIFDVDDIYRRGSKEDPIDGFGISLREILQSLGTDWGRHMVSEDIWVKVLDKRISERYSDFDIVIISDIRFDNERDYVINNGGKVINIASVKDKHNKSKFSEHASEWGIEDGVEGVIELKNDFSARYLVSLKEVFESMVPA